MRLDVHAVGESGDVNGADAERPSIERAMAACEPHYGRAIEYDAEYARDYPTTALVTVSRMETGRVIVAKSYVGIRPTPMTNVMTRVRQQNLWALPVNTISVNKYYAFAQDIDQQLYICQQPCSGFWEPVNDGLRLTSVRLSRAEDSDGGHADLWGVDTAGRQYAEHVNGHSSHKWLRTPTGVMGNDALRQISAGKSFAYGVTARQELYRCALPACKWAPKWTAVSGIFFKQVEVIGEEVWGLTAYGELWFSTAGYDRFRFVDSPPLLEVAVNEEWIWGIQESDMLVAVCHRPCLGEWRNVAGMNKRMDHVSAGDDNIWITDASGNMFKAGSLRSLTQQFKSRRLHSTLSQKASHNQCLTIYTTSVPRLTLPVERINESVVDDAPWFQAALKKVKGQGGGGQTTPSKKERRYVHEPLQKVDTDSEDHFVAVSANGYEVWVMKRQGP